MHMVLIHPYSVFRVSSSVLFLYESHELCDALNGPFSNHLNIDHEYLCIARCDRTLCGCEKYFLMCREQITVYISLIPIRKLGHRQQNNIKIQMMWFHAFHFPFSIAEPSIWGNIRFNSTCVKIWMWDKMGFVVFTHDHFALSLFSISVPYISINWQVRPYNSKVFISLTHCC